MNENLLPSTGFTVSSTARLIVILRPLYPNETVTQQIRRKEPEDVLCPRRKLDGLLQARLVARGGLGLGIRLGLGWSRCRQSNIKAAGERIDGNKHCYHRQQLQL